MEMVDAALQPEQDKVDQLMKRFEVLLAEGRGRLAEEAAVAAERTVDRLPAVVRIRP